MPRATFPPDLWHTLLSVWRSSAGRPSAPGGLSTDEQYQVSRQVRELSRGFTRDRRLAGERYLSDPGFLGAYLLHFWPVSYSQALLCLEMGKKARVTSALDVGAGPGPVSLALLDSGAARVTACDRSAAALSLARKLASARGHALTTRTWDSTRSTGMPRGPFDLIAIGHTLNELWAGHPERIALRIELVHRLSEELSANGRILILEPALKGTAQEAIRVRDGLVKEGLAVEAPCIWQKDCPALPEGTCHGEFDWNPPPGMVRLAHAARIGRETLKVAWFILRKRTDGTALEDSAPGAGTEPTMSADGGLYRVVSEPLLSKSGRIRYLVCGPLGRFALSARRDSPGAALKPFFSLSRGDGIRFTGSRARESGWGLDEESSVQVVERAARLG
jgi:protein-L-isoaspartate O-methyltransferase